MEGPARYLLRIDDLCPTVARTGWQQIRSLIQDFRLQPILAVVPDNRDPDLVCSAPDANFWNTMRNMQDAGAVIALHGYQHTCVSHARSLLGIHHASEFAGIPLETQRCWIGAGRDLLVREGLTPRIWAAPRHGFDRNTLCALRETGILYLSDGFARKPLFRNGITWIPQQLWGPIAMPKGLWTICLHPNTISVSDISAFRGFLLEHACRFVSFEDVIATQDERGFDIPERIFSRCAVWRIRLRSVRRGIVSRLLGTP